jgi:hypothetical protein
MRQRLINANKQKRRDPIKPETYFEHRINAVERQLLDLTPPQLIDTLTDEVREFLFKDDTQKNFAKRWLYKKNHVPAESRNPPAEGNDENINQTGRQANRETLPNLAHQPNAAAQTQRPPNQGHPFQTPVRPRPPLQPQPATAQAANRHATPKPPGASQNQTTAQPTRNLRQQPTTATPMQHPAAQHPETSGHYYPRDTINSPFSGPNALPFRPGAPTPGIQYTPGMQQAPSPWNTQQTPM